MDNAALWQGTFGNDYHTRQVQRLPANLALFAKILSYTGGVSEVVEFGAGTGDNLKAIRQLLPDARLTGVEINSGAANELSKNCHNAIVGNILDYVPLVTWDLVLTKGLLIHIRPEQLELARQILHTCSRRYVVLCEYFSPHPRMVPYRGHQDALWARDYGGEMLDQFPNLRLVWYGFTSKRDVFAQDDLTTWIMERR